jgi:hypothetical protein
VESHISRKTSEMWGTRRWMRGWSQKAGSARTSVAASFSIERGEVEGFVWMIFHGKGFLAERSGVEGPFLGKNHNFQLLSFMQFSRLSKQNRRMIFTLVQTRTDNIPAHLRCDA